METSPYFILQPWCIKPPDIIFDLVHLKKDHTNALVYRQHFLDIKNKFCDFILVYTDGSRYDNAVASATVFPAEAQLIIDPPDKIQHFYESKYIFHIHMHINPHLLNKELIK